jgi:radical SAM protein with 4Fe4S-binding SPASM domain
VLFRSVEYANQRGILVNTNTNATLLEEEAIQKICSVNIGEIGISIESPEKKTYEKIRKGAKFEEVMRNIKRLTEKLKEENKKTIVSFAVTILKENVEDIPKFVKLAEEVGIKKIVFQTMQNKEDYLSKYSAKAKRQGIFDLAERVKEKVEEAMEIAKDRGISLIFDEGKGSIGCVWPWRSIYISWNGYATACCKILDYRSPYLGNILKEDLWKVWNGEEYQKFRNLLRDRKAPIPCRGCSMI